MGHRDRRPTFGQAGQGPAQYPLGFRVDVGGRLVQQQQPRIGQLGPRQGDQLAFTHRQRTAALAHGGLGAVGQLGHPLGQAKGGERRLDVGSGGTGTPQRHVGGHGVVEEKPVLGNEPDRPVPGCGIDVAQVDTAEEHSTELRVGQPTQQLGQGGLARAGLADDRYGRSGRNLERDVVQHRLARQVRKGHVVHSDSEGALGQRQPGGGLDDVDRLVQQAEDLAPTGQRCLGLVEHLADLGDRLGQLVGQQQAGDDHTGGEAPRPGEVQPRTGDDRQQQPTEEVRHREHDREEEAGAQLRGQLLADGTMQVAAGVLGVVIGPDDAHAGHGLGDAPERVTDPVAQRVVGDELAPLHDDHDRHHWGEHDNRQHAQLPRVDEHRDQRDDEHA